MVPDLENQNYIQLMEPEYMNLSPREASLVSSGSAKTKLGLPSLKNKKGWGKSFICLMCEFCVANYSGLRAKDRSYKQVL